jgi:Restriction endonuclease NotI
LPINPETIIGEVLGIAARKAVDPKGDDFQCPFIQSRCVKRSARYPLDPYPVCSVWKGNSSPPNPLTDLICVCPKRFYAVDFLKDVVAHCWPTPAPANAKVVPEVKMKGFGNVDFVIADVDADGAIGQFLSVELQAIDITGSVSPAYDSLRAATDLAKRPTYGLNWDNVYKRYVTQLIRKGYFHHHWRSKIVAVIQDQIYQNMTARAQFMRTSNVQDQTVNIIFMSYRFDNDPDRPGQFRPILVTVEGTSHASLQSAMMYKDAPSREAFCDQIKRSMHRARPLAD